MPSDRIFSWIVDKGPDFIDKIYGKSVDMENISNSASAIFACRAIFQSLSELSKTFLMRMLFTSTVNRIETIDWVKDKNFHNSTFDELIKLRLLILKSESDANNYLVNQYFKDNFIQSLVSFTEPWIIDSTNNVTLNDLNQSIDLMNIEILESFAIDKWNYILKYLMNIELRVVDEHVTSSIKKFLKDHLKLIEITSNKSNEHILTSIGYEFMLKSYQNQVSS